MCLLSQAVKSEEDLRSLSLEQLLKVTVVSLFEETELDTSSSVYVIEEEEWLNYGARRTNEIMGYQPSTVNYTTLGGSSAFAVRGFANRLSVRGMATLIDGVPVNSFSFGTAQYLLPNFDLGALQKAELIRGPGSATYGSDAFHGVFALKTFHSDIDQVTTELGAGSNNFYQFNTRFSQEISTDSRINAALATTSQGSQNILFGIPNTQQTGQRKDEYKSTTAYLLFDQRINDKWFGQFGVYNNQFESDDFPSIGVVSLAENDLSDGDAEFNLYKADLKRTIDGRQAVEIKAFHWQSEQTFFYRIPGIPLQNQNDHRSGVSVTYKDSGTKEQARWLVGASIDAQKVTSAILASGLQPFDGLSREVNSLFSQIRIPFQANAFAIDLGIRIDDYSDFGAQTTPRIGLIYRPEDNVAYKFLYGNAFRAPVGGELTYSGVIQGNPTLKPETIDTYELVWMTRHGETGFTATLFKSEWTEAIVIVDDDSLPAPFTRKYVNQGQLESEGLEFEYFYHGTNWRIDASVSFVDSKDMTQQQRFVAFPKIQLKTYLSYAFDDTGLTLAFSNQYWSDLKASPSQDASKLDSVWQNNLHLNYQWQDNLAIRVNLHDALDNNDPTPSLWGNPQGLLSAGRQFSTYIQYQW